MEKEIKHFVEEYVIDHFFEGFVKEIDSRENYINNFNDGECTVLFRFFDREIIKYNGIKYISEPINYTIFIKNPASDRLVKYIIPYLLNEHIFLKDSNFNKTVLIDDIIMLDDYKKKVLKR